MTVTLEQTLLDIVVDGEANRFNLHAEFYYVYAFSL